MKYPAHYYAKALIAALKEVKPGDDDRIAKNFLALVRKNGDGVHLRKILEEAGRFSRGVGGVRKVTLASARPLNAAQRTMVDALFNTTDIIEERINPALIAGIKIIVNDEAQWDASLKGKLDKVFTK